MYRKLCFPKSINKTLKRIYPRLSDDDIEMVFKGLREYFKLYAIARRNIIPMPSKVVDRAWLEFIYNEKEYKEFCNKTFARYLNKSPLKTMIDNNTACSDIKIVWVLACDLNDIDPKNPTELPLLFSLDASLDILDGYKYTLDCENDTSSYCAKSIGKLGIHGAYGNGLM